MRKKPFLCKIGLHKMDRHRYEFARVHNGRHKWHRRYIICQRCGKRLAMFGIKKARDTK